LRKLPFTGSFVDDGQTRDCKLASAFETKETLQVNPLDPGPGMLAYGQLTSASGDELVIAIKDRTFGDDESVVSKTGEDASSAGPL